MKTKTSASDPLRIAAVTVPGASGVIGLTFCPDKKDALASAGPCERDLETDLDAIKTFGATALVTLMEPGELLHPACAYHAGDVEQRPSGAGRRYEKH